MLNIRKREKVKIKILEKNMLSRLLIGREIFFFRTKYAYSRSFEVKVPKNRMENTVETLFGGLNKIFCR